MSRYRKSERTGLSGSSVIAGICLMLFIFSFSVVLVLNFRWLYYLDVKWLDLERYSGFGAEEIRRNYDALITYNQVWHQTPLVFPTLPMSESAAIHFMEVKKIFDAVQIICGITGIMSLISAFAMGRKKDRRWLKYAGVLTLIVPIVLGILVAVNWQQFFITFHHLFFKNDYWLFDPATDPIILMLPDTYFLHCAAGILLMILIGSALCLAAGRRGKAARVTERRNSSRYRD